MKLRTVRTFDEIEAFYTMIRDRYPDYNHPRLSPVHYGVFDVGEDTKGWGEEGEWLVAGAAVDIGGWDIFAEGGVTEAIFESLIVKPEFRNRGIGTALLNFIVESHCDLTIRLRVSKSDEWKRLVPWYERFAFSVTSQAGNEVFMEREPDDDGEIYAPELRVRAADRLIGEDRKGLELDDFNP